MDVENRITAIERNAAELLAKQAVTTRRGGWGLRACGGSIAEEVAAEVGDGRCQGLRLTTKLVGQLGRGKRATREVNAFVQRSGSVTIWNSASAIAESSSRRSA